MRQVVLDTETTGLEPTQGHRIIEIGGVELINRRKTGNVYHQYINPERDVEDGAYDVHGISNETLADKPVFAGIAREFMDFIRGSELIIHNAPFDVGFINAELANLGKSWGQVSDHCRILDTLVLAREKHPGQKNSLDALCKRYEVDNSQRQLHGALLDAQILVDVYLLLTGGQTHLTLDHAGPESGQSPETVELPANRPQLRVLLPADEEVEFHRQRLAEIAAISGKPTIWDELEFD